MQTHEGRRLIAHELTHVVQQSPAGTTSVIQRVIKPEDVAGEMVGREFELADAFTSGWRRVIGSR